MAHADLEALLDAALPFAKLMLKKHGEFFPYGASMGMDGKIADVGVYDGDEHPASADVIAMLREAFQSEAKDGHIRASAVCYDCLVIPPGADSKIDAVALALDHENGESVVVFAPYKKGRFGKYSFDSFFSSKGENLIWPRS